MPNLQSWVKTHQKKGYSRRELEDALAHKGTPSRTARPQHTMPKAFPLAVVLLIAAGALLWLLDSSGEAPSADDFSVDESSKSAQASTALEQNRGYIRPDDADLRHFVERTSHEQTSYSQFMAGVVAENNANTLVLSRNNRFLGLEKPNFTSYYDGTSTPVSPIAQAQLTKDDYVTALLVIDTETGETKNLVITLRRKGEA